MIHCRLADLNFEINPMYEFLPLKLSGYCFDFEQPDIIINMSQRDIEYEKTIGTAPKSVRDGSLEITAGLRRIAETLPKYNAVLLHACAFKIKEKGIAFGALSGTGKTTHMLLWQKIFGKEITVINGDKPILRFLEDKLYIYGSPWAGKEGLHNNIKVPLTDICRIKRSVNNNTRQISKDEGLKLLLNQVYMPYDVQMRFKTLELINKISDNVNFWEIECNKDIAAAETSFNAIFGKEPAMQK